MVHFIIRFGFWAIRIKKTHIRIKQKTALFLFPAREICITKALPYTKTHRLSENTQGMFKTLAVYEISLVFSECHGSLNHKGIGLCSHLVTGHASRRFSLGTHGARAKYKV